jgi:hypothetical protein
MNSNWAEHYAKERMSDLAREARGSQIVNSSKRSVRHRAISSFAPGRLVARFSAAALRFRPAGALAEPVRPSAEAGQPNGATSRP